MVGDKGIEGRSPREYTQKPPVEVPKDVGRPGEIPTESGRPSPALQAAIGKARNALGMVGRSFMRGPDKIVTGAEEVVSKLKTKPGGEKTQQGAIEYQTRRGRELFGDLTPGERSRVNEEFGGRKPGESFQDADKRFDEAAANVRASRNATETKTTQSEE